VPHPSRSAPSGPSSTRSVSRASRRILATSLLLVSTLLVLTSGMAPGTSAWLRLGAPSIAHAASNDNNVEWDGLYSDQTALYMNPTQPGSGNAVTVKLRTFTGDITSANVKYYDTACSCYNWIGMSWAAHDVTGTFDIWQATIPASASTKYYRFQINDGTATAWLNQAGITSTEPSSGDFWIVPGFSLPAWAYSGVGYQIFPDRFYNGDPTNDVTSGAWTYCTSATSCYPTLQQAWGNLPENPQHGRDFFGGDLNGVQQKIDSYLKQTLGVTVLYLNPIFQSPSNHHYDTQDYTQVDPHFGGNSAYNQMVATAHSTTDYSGDYRMNVVLDGVFNHSSDWNQWFNHYGPYTTLGAYQSQSSQWYTYYDFPNGWPNGYCAWGGYATLPKLDYANQNLLSTVITGPNSVARTWVSGTYAADGWRLDVANELGDACSATNNDLHWQQFRTAVKGANPNALIIGEYWGKPTEWLHGNEWDGTMNYNGFNTPVSEFITQQDLHGNATGYMAPSAFGNWLFGTLGDNPWWSENVMWNELGTHDTMRFLTRAGNNVGELNEAIVIQMTWMGMPMLYYGDEIGMQGGNDPDNRRTFDWNSADWNNSVLGRYQTLISLRKSVTALQTGSVRRLVVDDTNNVFAYGRWDATHQVAVLVNNDPSNWQQITVPVYQMSVPNGAIMTDQLHGTQYTVSNGTISAWLSPHDATVIMR
jgi:alpha-glucosidase